MPTDPRPASDDSTPAQVPLEEGTASHEPAAPMSDDGASTVEPAHPRGSWSRWLPWGLVAALSVACIVLGTLYADARRGVADPAPATPAASVAATTPAPGGAAAARISAAPTTGGQAPAMLSLQRRDPNDPRALGKADAPIVLIEWADFRCPYCAVWYQQTLPQLVPYIKSGSLRVEFRDLVIFGDESAAAARAAHAAGLQGHFWDYSQLLWAQHTGNGHPEISDQMLQDMASQAGVADVAKFNADRTSQAVIDAVNQESAQATSMGLQATPFFLVNTTTVPGAYPADTFVDLVQQYGGRAN